VRWKSWYARDAGKVGSTRNRTHIAGQKLSFAAALVSRRSGLMARPPLALNPAGSGHHHDGPAALVDLACLRQSFYSAQQTKRLSHSDDCAKPLPQLIRK
jgi:hypothetical protein